MAINRDNGNSDIKPGTSSTEITKLESEEDRKKREDSHSEEKGEK